MSLTLTLIILAVCLAVLGLAQIRERRKYEPGRISLIPWVPLQFVAMMGMILMLAHLVSLLTGEPLVGRMMR
jgi:choline-glycine betaine transporter